ncbi:MAG: hypothetical protein LLG04_13550 [Parachlamydia sp.]|nr:hypothetical protein [Parachlamydia sp.]
MASPIHRNPPILGTPASFYLSDRVATSVGNESWKASLCHESVVGSLVANAGSVLIAQTPQELFGVNPANGSILWNIKAAGIGNIILAPDKRLIHFQGDGKELVIRSAVDGSVENKIEVMANPMFTPRLTSNQLILIQEQSGDKTRVCAFDLSLKKEWEITLPFSHSTLQAFPFKEAILITTEQGLQCYTLEGKSLWSLDPSHFGGHIPHLVAKLSDDQMLLQFSQAGLPAQVVTLSTREVKALHLPAKIVGYPIVLQKDSGEYALFYQMPPKNMGFGRQEYRLVMVDAHGRKQWEVKDNEQPRFMIADHDGNVFIAFSPTLEQFRLYGGLEQQSPLSYVRSFDANGKELYKKIPSTHPILSPLSIGIEGELYYFTNGTLHAVK